MYSKDVFIIMNISCLSSVTSNHRLEVESLFGQFEMIPRDATLFVGQNIRNHHNSLECDVIQCIM